MPQGHATHAGVSLPSLWAGLGVSLLRSVCSCLVVGRSGSGLVWSVASVCPSVCLPARSVQRPRLDRDEQDQPTNLTKEKMIKILEFPVFLFDARLKVLDFPVFLCLGHSMHV